MELSGKTIIYGMFFGACAALFAVLVSRSLVPTEGLARGASGEEHVVGRQAAARRQGSSGGVDCHVLCRGHHSVWLGCSRPVADLCP